MSVLYRHLDGSITVDGEHFVPAPVVAEEVEVVEGCWLAYHSDWSGFQTFASEIEAYRHATPYSMSVIFLPFGVEPREVRHG